MLCDFHHCTEAQEKKNSSKERNIGGLCMYLLHNIISANFQPVSTT